MTKQNENFDFDDFDIDGDIIEDAKDIQEVEEVQEVTEIIEEPKVAPKKSTAVATKQETAVSGSFDFDFSELSIPGVVVGGIGLEVSRFPVERARFTTSAKSLISVVSSNIVAVKTHFSEELGSYLCFGGKCCEKDGLPRIKYLLPVVLYDTDKNGKPVSSDVQFKALSIGYDQYEDIKTINDLTGDITTVDLLVTCKDEQYQKISLQQAGNARWKSSKKIMKEVHSFWSKNMKDIVQSTARVVTEKDFMKKCGYDAGPQDADINFSDVF